MADAVDTRTERSWFIVSRWQEYAGENRANLLRVIGIGVFYSIQLIHYYGFSDRGTAEHSFHEAATALAATWSVMALGVLLCLRSEFFPGALKFVSTATDIVLLSGLAMIGSKAHSPLVMVYFVIIALAALRFSLRLMWFATLGCMAAYEALVAMADPVWFDAEHIVAPVEQLTVLASLALTGLLMGQVIRRVRAMAEDYAVRAKIVQPIPQEERNDA